jgi:cytochrome c553
MKNNLPYFAILFVLIYASYNALFKEKEERSINKNRKYVKHIETHKIEHCIEELSNINSTSYVKEYIISVINHGSNQFNFKGGVMEGGFAPAADAEKIACYVLEFSGKRCKKPYNKNAAMFYSSNCAGCHGDDGKGLKGTYPDLTKEKFLGIKKREIYLKSIKCKENFKKI